jgi:transcriptional regulator with XRE-family HTH domain
MKNKHLGSNFDDFLKEEGLLEEVEAVAAKRVFVFQLEKELKRQKVNKEELAQRMGTSRSAVRRLLDPSQPSTLRTLGQAAHALGKQLQLSLV